MSFLLLIVGLLPALPADLFPGRSFSLVSWNLLSPTFAPPGRYPWASDDVLGWRTRGPRIVETLRTMDADVVCLQEVDVALWGDFSRDLSELGYDAVLQDMDGEHPIANAVLFRRATLRCVRSESRSRALIAVLESTTCTGPASEPLYVANVHLEAGAEKASQRFYQLKSLLKRLMLQRANDVAVAKGRPSTLSPSTEPAGAALVIAGDFNFDRRSALHHLLSTGSLPENPAQGAFGESAPVVRRYEYYSTNIVTIPDGAYGTWAPLGLTQPTCCSATRRGSPTFETRTRIIYSACLTLYMT